MQPTEQQPSLAASAPSTPGSRLAVCLFTHHGRRDVLAEGLEAALEQLDDDPRLDDVEICLTDNASYDGTAEMVAALNAVHGGRIRYQRHERDLGLSANLLACVAMARSDYCWIMTSDDVLEPGAIARVCELIESTGTPPGVIVGKANFDFSMTELTGQGGADFYPPQHQRTEQYSETQAFLEDCGLLASLVSVMIVRRANWLAAVDALGGSSAHAQSTLFPHLPILVEMARRDPRWVWCPAKLVRARMGNASMAKDEGLSIEQVHVRYLSDMSRMWSEQLASERPLRRALMRRAYRTFATPDVLRAIAPEGRTKRQAAALALAYAPIFWFAPDFWLRSVPALMAHSAGASPPERAMPPLAIEDRRARIEAANPPREVPNSHEFMLSMLLENASRFDFRAQGEHRVVVGYRWYDDEGELRLQGPPIALRGDIASGESAHCQADVLTPRDAGDYQLCVTLAQEGIGWFDDRTAELSCRLPITVRRYGWSDRP